MHPSIHLIKERKVNRFFYISLIIFVLKYWCLLVNNKFLHIIQSNHNKSPVNLVIIISLSKNNLMKLNNLTPEEEHVIIHKGTETPFSGKYLLNNEKGMYLCKRCDAPLYKSSDKFESHCGWPSFDDEIPGAVKRVPDADGRRTEIVCTNCEAHLGHVFEGEGLTPKNIRHCVNSISLKFQAEKEHTKEEKYETAYFASGCFWGTEYHFMKAKGAIKTTVGFMGGDVKKPTYQQVCGKETGHAETTQVVFDKQTTNYEDMVKLFFETHDFTQTDGQGPDIGPQYRSVIFYTSEEQKDIAEKYKKILEEKGYKVATSIEPASSFWLAEDYHQQYYFYKGTTPYCHIYRKIFD